MKSKRIIKLCKNLGLKRNKNGAEIHNRMHIRTHTPSVRRRTTSLRFGSRGCRSRWRSPQWIYKTAEAHAISSAFHQTHGHAQIQLVYGRDMFYQSTARLIGRKRLQENKRKFTRRMNEKTRKQINHNNCKRDWVTMIRPGVPERILANSRKGPYKAVRQETKWTHHNPNITKYNEEYQSKQTTPILPTCHGFSHRVLVQTPFENTNKSKNSLKWK